MRHFTVNQIKKILFNTLSDLGNRRQDFLTHPESDFTRRRKISFEDTLLFPMLAASGSLGSEILDYFEEVNLPTPSALIQRRSLVKPSAFIELFQQFTSKIPKGKRFQGYRLLAVDGSRLNLPYNPKDPDSFIQCIEGRKGINQIHLNTLYDIQNGLFLDCIPQGIHEMDEKAAFCAFSDRYKDSSFKSIFVADRGYASYNIFANLTGNGHKFVIRIPENFAKHLAVNVPGWLEGEREDTVITFHVGRRNKKVFSELENYHYIPTQRHYDNIPAHSDAVDRFELRVLKFPLNGSHEFIITNLKQSRFPSETIQEIYNLRWGIETAYRHLKYADDMVRLHSTKKEFLLQEIYGKLTMYNFVSFVVSETDPADREEKEKMRKHQYVVNMTQAFKICIRYLRGQLHYVADLIAQNVVPVRTGRKFERNLRRQSADTMNYR